MFENLSEKLQSVFGGLKSKGRLSEADIDAAMKEIRMALLEADVNFKVVKGFCKRTKERCMVAEVMESLTPAQNVIKIVNDELAALLGGDTMKVDFGSRIPGVIMMVGLQGSGKTTASAKLAYRLSKQNHVPELVACDVYRPAAADQLQTLGDEQGVRVYRGDGVDPVQIAKEGVRDAIDNMRDVVIIDTAGRLHNKVGLMNELGKIRRVMQKLVPDAPHEVLLVLDASTGQNAVEQARQFTDATDVNALALTKLDGTAKGGVIIGISDQLQVPVKYIGLGEHMEDLQLFNRREFVDSLFGNR